MSAHPKYIHPVAQTALERACQNANLRPVIVQTQGDAKQSAGTHGSAGTYSLNGKRQSYSACIDFSVNQPATRLSDGKKVVMDRARIKWFLYCLAKAGFTAWYRTTKQGFSGAHIHAVCAMVPISGLPEAQVLDFLDNRTGLKGGAKEEFWTANNDVDSYIATHFAKANPEAAHRLPAHLRGTLV